MNRLLSLGLLLIVTVMVAGCASWGGFHQAVPVRSDPPGSKVLLDGRAVGRTPVMVRTRRFWFDREVTFISPDGKEKRNVPLRSRYRWGEGFWGNLVFLTYAPVGWVVDFFGGAAFGYDPLPFVTLPKSMVRDQPEERKKVAVSRPIAEALDEEVLDSMGAWLAEEMQKRRPEWSVLPYDETKGEFHRLEYAFIRDANWRDVRSALAELNVKKDVSEVVTSEVVRAGDETRLSWSVLDQEYGAVLDRGEFSIPDDQVSVLKQGRWARRLGLWFRILPNNLGLEATGDEVTLSQNNVDYRGQARSSGGWLGKVGEVLSGVHVAYVQPPTTRRSWRFGWRAFPMLMLRYGRLQFPLLPGNENTEFNRFTGFLGWGAQAGWSSRWGQPYLSMHIGPSFTHIEWSKAGARGVEQANAMSSSVEVGYLYFLTDSLNVRLFARSLEESPVVWTRATQAAGASNSRVENSTVIYSGVSLSYYFPEHRHPGRWLFGEE